MNRRAPIVLAVLGCSFLLVRCIAGRVGPLAAGVRFHPKTGAPIVLPGPDGSGTLLHSGWRISAVGRPLDVGDMLAPGAMSPDGKMLAVVNCGFGAHALNLVSIDEERLIARLRIPRAFCGVAWSADGSRVYASGGIGNAQQDIYVFARDPDGQWKPAGGMKIGTTASTRCVAGLAVSRDGSALYALNVADGALYVLDAQTGSGLAKLAVGDHPLACRLSADGRTLFVANWGGSEVAVVEVLNSARPTLKARWRVGAHPNDLALGSDGRLFVSCGNVDAVFALDTTSGAHAETVRTALSPRAALGSTAVSLALSPDGKTLYAANADNNDVCVIDVSQPGHSRVRGFIPTGWYPTCVSVSADGRKVIVGAGKGTGTRPNPAKAPIDPVVPAGFQYIGTQLAGQLRFVDTPDERTLASYTRQVWANTPYNDSQLRRARASMKTVVPTRVGSRCPIRHVLYIIKENRTYDQVYGDMPRGNGDPALCLFGREVTPNQHALADEYVLLDNIYCSGEVSADGHPWSTSAYATDFTQRAWTLSYSGHGGLPGGDGVDEPGGGYIWDACRRKGLSYRSYGEYVHATSSEAAPEQRVAGAKGLIGHGSPTYVGIGWPKGKPMRDTDKADAFIAEFRDFERTGTIPNFMVMSLGENHTNGTRPGSFTPKACVASNDVAVGKIVDAISHSSAWPRFAIFIIEDDAQNGPDHVDSHRTAALVVSPYARRGIVDSTFYTTTSVLRTMELILGLPPLTQHDAAATPMFACFADQADTRPFTALSARIDVNVKNTVTAYGAAESARMDWSGFDRVDEQNLNRILWRSIKGAQARVPAPVRRALVGPTGRVLTSRSVRDGDE